MSCRTAMVGVLAGLAPVLAASADYPRPEAHFEAVIGAIVADVAAAHGALGQDTDNCLAFALVDQYFRPEFDLHVAGRRILNRFWPSDAGAQDRFVAIFYDHLVATYGDLIRHFNEDTFEFIPLDRDPEIESVKLGSWLTFNDGTTARVDFDLRYIDGRWQIVDVIVDERMSYVKNFRSDFLYEIADIGFDGLIDLLEKEAAPRRECGP